MGRLRCAACGKEITRKLNGGLRFHCDYTLIEPDEIRSMQFSATKSYLMDVFRRFGDQFLGYATGLHLPEGADIINIATVLFFEDRWQDHIASVVGDRKFYIRSIGLKENLYCRETDVSVTPSMLDAYPDTLIYGHDLLQSMALMVVGIIFAD